MLLRGQLSGTLRGAPFTFAFASMNVIPIKATLSRPAPVTARRENIGGFEAIAEQGKFGVMEPLG